jgi:malonate transporter and related proteins
VFSIIAFHAPMLITIGMLVMELVRRDGAPLHKALGVAAIRIVQNPLLWAVALGLLGNMMKVKLAEPANAFLVMMSAAVLPAALFGLGGALNEYRLADNWAQALAMSVFKLMIHPTIAWVLMVPILHVDIEVARYGVLLAAMPTGINAYVFATYYNRAVNVATNTVLISTVASVLTVSVWLYILSL